MKQSIFLFLAITIIGASCVKDRLQGTGTGPVVVTPAANDTLMYYWDFNNADSADHSPAFGVSPAANFKYYASYIDYTTGSSLNLFGTSVAGDCLRLRNPSDSMIFFMPTTNYDSVKLSFAEQRSGSGPSQNAIYYTVDGTHYISTALSNNVYTVDTLFTQYTFDLSADAQIKHNPKFAVKIVIQNNNTSTSGNDRFDNISLMGKRK